MFIGLLRLSGSLANKCMSLNNEQCKAIPALFNLNPIELNCYWFMFMFRISVQNKKEM